MNRAIALAEIAGPAAALAAVEPLGMVDYHLYHATRGDLPERLGHLDAAAAAFENAASLATNGAERRYLTGRRDDVISRA